MERQNRNARYVTDTIDRKCRFIQLRGGLCEPEDMARLKKAGVGVNYYGTNDAATLKKLFDAGVDFPLVDRTAEMLQVARSLGIEPLRPIFRKSPKTKATKQ
jgi:glycerophosphoryl diester phosphodiesterase